MHAIWMRLGARSTRGSAGGAGVAETCSTSSDGREADSRAPSFCPQVTGCHTEARPRLQSNISSGPCIANTAIRNKLMRLTFWVCALAKRISQHATQIPFVIVCGAAWTHKQTSGVSLCPPVHPGWGAGATSVILTSSCARVRRSSPHSPTTVQTLVWPVQSLRSCFVISRSDWLSACSSRKSAHMR